MYILRPSYGDMGVVMLGAQVKTVIKRLRKHWVDAINNPDEYDDGCLSNIRLILEKDYMCGDDIMHDYNDLMNEDYVMEKSS